MSTNSKPAVATNGDLTFTPIKRAQILVPIAGTSPLVMSKWLEKSLRQMEEAQQKKAKKALEARDPHSEFVGHVYRLPDGRPGMPATAFKSALVTSARLFGKEVAMAALKTTVFVAGVGPENLVPINAPEPEMWTNAVRNANGGTDLRYRPRFWPWTAELLITYASPTWSVDQIISFVDAAGMGGVGEWRPSSPKSASGTYGMFTIQSE